MVNFTVGQGSLAFEGPEGDVSFFKISEMRIHAPSEHTVNGENMDVELQLYHQAYNGSTIAVVSLFFDTHEGGDKTSNFINSLLLSRRDNPLASYIPL
jgi:carbonic anhydrase